MTNNIIVDCQNLSKTFADKEVLKNCQLKVEQGSIYGLLGANGAGKTTLFKILTGLLKPTSGNFSLLNHKSNLTDLAHIGLLIETPTFYEHLSAQENLSIHLAYMNKEGADIETTLKRVGLGDTGTKPVSKFSLGMRQRLALARAIIHQPKLLILDEPINGLDPIGIREMRLLFLDLAKREGMTLLISSHILPEIEHIADTIGVLFDGQIIKEVSMAEIKEQEGFSLEDYFMNLMIGGNHYA